MQILIVSDVYPPLIGGVELQMQLLSHKLLQRGHSVTIATSWQVGLLEEEDDDGVDVYRIKGFASLVPWFSTNPGRRHYPPFPDPGTVWGLRQIINKVQPDVIHAYGWITYSCALALTGKDIPLLLSVREYGYTCALRTMMHYGRQPCDRPQPVKCLDCAMTYYGRPKGIAAAVGTYIGRPLLRRKTSGLHSVSTYMQESIRRDLFEGQTPARDSNHLPVPDVVIPSFRDSATSQREQDASQVQRYLDQLPSEPFILFVGALRLVKGLEPLLEAYRRLPSPPPLVLIGPVAPDTPTDYPDNVLVLHNFPHAAVMAAWERSLFGVAPSLWPEPFGNVIHEAMSKGKTVIGTKPGGQADMIVEGETGFLLPPGDVDALAETMQLLIDNNELREALGRSGQARARIFTSDEVVPQFEELYQQLANRARAIRWV